MFLIITMSSFLLTIFSFFRGEPNHLFQFMFSQNCLYCNFDSVVQHSYTRYVFELHMLSSLDT